MGVDQGGSRCMIAWLLAEPGLVIHWGCRWLHFTVAFDMQGYAILRIAVLCLECTAT